MLLWSFSNALAGLPEDSTRPADASAEAPAAPAAPAAADHDSTPNDVTTSVMDSDFGDEDGDTGGSHNTKAVATRRKGDLSLHRKASRETRKLEKLSRAQRYLLRLQDKGQPILFVTFLLVILLGMCHRWPTVLNLL